MILAVVVSGVVIFAVVVLFAVAVGLGVVMLEGRATAREARYLDDLRRLVGPRTRP